MSVNPSNMRSEWISVDTAIPNPGSEVLVVQDYGDDREVNKYIWDQHWRMNGITYWMPIPKLPEQEDDHG